MESASTLPDARVNSAWIAAHIDDPSVRFVEVDVSPSAYNAGHIPGAVLWNAYTDLRHSDYRPVSAAELQELLRKSAVTSDMTVVFYGYGAHLGFWLLKSHGHERVRLMDGSREQWKSAGQDWSTDIPVLVRSQYSLAAQDAFFSSREDVQRMIGQPGRVILDTRSKAEYDGERFWPSGATEGAGRAGHIPGAVHIPVELLRTEDGAFRSAGEMLQVMQDHGITPETEVVTYCTIGNRASQAWFALTYLLGCHDARVYYGSWAEWGKLADTPIENSGGGK
ncbi:sulfurtransferase [Undibacterium sp.]|jgi:thiosulfate/3-mercaptopyruvate sulfurtransferase|uniref:sulfurtransferase n=1 Tax=Undibacterium sp. TaxID=1914977 RepID=UPI002CE62BEA|nr:sulfurtransferase [Undibacterium sp.]HTD06736.1 sulfurtransferase [Undibacterium sp.]